MTFKEREAIFSKECLTIADIENYLMLVIRMPQELSET